MLTVKSRGTAKKPIHSDTQKTVSKSGQNPKMCLGNPWERWKKRNGGNKQKTNDKLADVKS